ncbi:galanin receptor 2b-like [Glandiceps talaboti]
METTAIATTYNYNITYNDTLNTSTETTQDRIYPEGNTVYTVFLVVISTFGIVGNGAFIHVMRKVKYMHTVTNIYLLNLCTADIFFLTLGAVMRLLPMYLDYLSLLCLLQNFTTYMASFASMFTISLICIERYVAICHPLKRRHFHLQRMRCVRHIVFIWILAMLFTIPSVIYCYLTDLTMFFVSSIVKTVPFFLSLIIIILSYTLIICKLTCRQTVAEKLLEKTMTSKRRKRRLHVVCMLLVTAIVYFVCLLPFHLLQYIIIANSINASMQAQTIQLFLRVSEILLYINASVNPLIYNIMSVQYRKAFKKAFGCIDDKSSDDRYFSTNYKTYRCSSVFNVPNGNRQTDDMPDIERNAEINEEQLANPENHDDRISVLDQMDPVHNMQGFDNFAFVNEDSIEVNNNENNNSSNSSRSCRKHSSVSFSSFNIVYELDNEKGMTTALPFNDDTLNTWL